MGRAGEGELAAEWGANCMAAFQMALKTMKEKLWKDPGVPPAGWSHAVPPDTPRRCCQQSLSPWAAPCSAALADGSVFSHFISFTAAAQLPSLHSDLPQVIAAPRLQRGPGVPWTLSDV